MMSDELKINGIGRDADHSRALVLYFNRPPTDDEMRLIHERAKADLRPSAGPDEGLADAAARQRIAEIAARAEKATNGNWTFDPRSGLLWARQGDVCICEVNSSRDDGQFLADAHADIPWLLQHIANLSKQRDAVYVAGQLAMRNRVVREIDAARPVYKAADKPIETDAAIDGAFVSLACHIVSTLHPAPPAEGDAS